MRRREFIAGLGSAGTWPIFARAQSAATPVIGLLGLAESTREVVAAIHKGLTETGFAEGRNLAIEYRWATEAEIDQLPRLAADLVDRDVKAIVALQTPAVVAVKAATSKVPIVFVTALDPVEAGFVQSFSRPVGNLTGIAALIIAVAGKRLDLLHQLIPGATSLAYLASSTNNALVRYETKEVESAAKALGIRLLVLRASQPSDLEPAFATAVREHVGGIVISGAAFFAGRADELIGLSARYAMPAIHGRREIIEAGGLMSYGTDFAEMYRQAGIYTGRILKGEKPADLPVQQVTKLELAINARTAKLLGLTVPETLLATADEVIE
jgi:putative tryptophan/tyrosine transport system substrate-binding protein